MTEMNQKSYVPLCPFCGIKNTSSSGFGGDSRVALKIPNNNLTKKVRWPGQRTAGQKPLVLDRKFSSLELMENMVKEGSTLSFA
jgi:hypothetical protein